MGLPTDDRWLDEVEKQLGRALPSAYRSRLKANNGGDLELADEGWQLHPVRDASDRERTRRSCNDVLSETAEMQEWDGFPANALAVAYNGSGDCLLLLPDERDPRVFGSSLYFWCHETRTVELVGDVADL